MYQRITGDDPFETPMKIFPATHYTMGGLWVDYNLQSNIPGLFVAGEANFSDHGANRLGASALMQGLADGYFVLPYTIGNYLADEKPGFSDTAHAAFNDAEGEAVGIIDKLLAVDGTTSADVFHRELGKIIWEHCGMARDQGGPRESRSGQAARPQGALLERSQGPGLRQPTSTSRSSVPVAWPTSSTSPRSCSATPSPRDESCGAHFREEHQHEDGEAKRDDKHFSHGAIWGYEGEGNAPSRHTEELTFNYVHPSTRSYK